MPWCPICREEYRQGFKTCIDCGVELVDELPPHEENDDAAEMNCLCETYLTTTADWSEAEVIESYLNAERIPVAKVADGSGVNIYVPVELLEKAKSIADGVREIAEEDGRHTAGEKDAEEYYSICEEKRRSAPAGDTLWCPKCRMEYRREFKLCSDCGLELVDKLAEIDDQIKPFCDAYLTTVADWPEAEMIKSCLNEDGIPVAKVAGVSGVDIYVPVELLEEAWDVVASVRQIARGNKRTGEEDAGSKEPAPPAAGGSGRLWCPHCRVEYWQEGIAVCSDCGAKLVDPATGMGKSGQS